MSLNLQAWIEESFCSQCISADTFASPSLSRSHFISPTRFPMALVSLSFSVCIAIFSSQASFPRWFKCCLDVLTRFLMAGSKFCTVAVAHTMAPLLLLAWSQYKIKQKRSSHSLRLALSQSRTGYCQTLPLSQPLHTNTRAETHTHVCIKYVCSSSCRPINVSYSYAQHIAVVCCFE